MMNFFQDLDSKTKGEWFITGSRAFGVNATTHADLDICIPICYKPYDLMISFSDFSKESEYSNGQVWTPLANLDSSSPLLTAKVNIIPLHPKEFLAWGIATQQIARTLYGYEKMKTKEFRVPYFEGLKSWAKTLLPELVTLEDLKSDKYQSFFITPDRDSFLAQGWVTGYKPTDDIPF